MTLQLVNKKTLNMAEAELRTVVASIQQCMRKPNKTTVVEIKYSAVSKVMQILESRKFITITPVKNFKYTVKVTNGTTAIITAREETLKSKDILNYVRRELPSLTGVVILSTHKGIMCIYDILQS